MSSPAGSNELFKELIKDPYVYVIAIFISAGSYLVKGENFTATWWIGLGLILFGCITFIIKLISNLFDANVKRRYTDIIDSQQKIIDGHIETINSLSKNTRDSYRTMVSPNPSFGENYNKPNIESTEIS